MNVTSEIGALKKVLLYRPGMELEHLLPAYMEDMLFDEIPWLERAREEHDAFARALTEAGTRVYYIQDLVADIMAERPIKEDLIREHLELSNIADPDTRSAVFEYLLDLPDNKTTELLTAGLHKRLVRDLKDHLSLSDLTPVGFPFYLPPLPSMYFMRDHGVMVGKDILMSSMFSEARKREPLFLRKVVKHHPLFADVEIIDTEPMPKGLEGGDVLVLSEDTLLVGLSQRTTEQAIETLALRLLGEQERLKQILVLQIPIQRAYMHLDTVFTMLDYDKFLFYPGIRDSVYLYRLTRGRSGRIHAEQLGDLKGGLTQALERPVQIIYTNGSSLHQASREQWNDSTNTLAVAPGKVVVYNRNTLANKTLRSAGIETIEIEGSELVRGRGGPRCMSLPLERE
ncbi:MAG: arginine deiminase [Firmicutes bacterium]|nr:arginine deiminase [Bacillota bacterium]